jgi:hypothetical protein
MSNLAGMSGSPWHIELLHKDDDEPIRDIRL